MDFLGGSNNFGHWLLNCVSRLNYLEFLDQNIPIIIHDYMPQRFIDCLSYFVDKNPIIKIPKQTILKIYMLVQQVGLLMKIQQLGGITIALFF